MIFSTEDYLAEIERLTKELEYERKMSVIHERAAASWRKQYEDLLATRPTPKTIPCVRCGKDVMQTPGKRARLYCSPGCKKAEYRERKLFQPLHSKPLVSAFITLTPWRVKGANTMKEARYIEPEYPHECDFDYDAEELEKHLAELKRLEQEANEHYQNLLASDTSTLGKEREPC